jgi:hypothetical protein
MGQIKSYITEKRLGVHQALRTALEYIADAIDVPSTVSPLKVVEVSINAADIVATGAGKFGHANGYPIVAAPGTTKYIEFISASLVFDYSTAGYTGGGNITVNATAGSAITGLVSAANSVGATADKFVQFYPLTTAGVVVVANTGLSLVAASAFTQPGTAAGTIKVRVTYREHTL